MDLRRFPERESTFTAQVKSRGNGLLGKLWKRGLKNLQTSDAAAVHGISQHGTRRAGLSRHRYIYEVPHRVTSVSRLLSRYGGAELQPWAAVQVSGW
jgi:hypothetical protein